MSDLPIALNTTTIQIAVTTIASNTVLPNLGSSIRISNAGYSDCFVLVSNTPTSVVIPSVGEILSGSYVMARSTEVFSIPTGELYVCVIGVNGPTTIFAQRGEGQ